ncbi:MAG: CheR family methyltransferase [Candidatus Hodarchaeota archaeon]
MPNEITEWVQFTFNDPENIEHIRNLLQAKGFNVSYKDKYFQRRLRMRMRRLDCSSYISYFRLLKQDPNEIEWLKRKLSINVTEFYRDPDVYQTFRVVFGQYVKEIIDKRDTSNIRIWSAGCAIGAEPYSIGILLTELLVLSSYDVKIIATDFNEDLLNEAKKGIYEAEILNSLNDRLKSKYFRQLNESQYKIRDRIKKLVEFSHLDLTSNIFLYKHLDVIFCRNVMIYFSRELQEQLVGNFYKALTPGGLLILGLTESVPQSFGNKFEVLSLKYRIYRKKGGSVLKESVEASETPKVPKFVCKKCNAIFHRMIDLEIHQKKHKKKKRSFRCPFCQKVLKDELRLKIHKQYAHGK